MLLALSGCLALWDRPERPVGDDVEVVDDTGRTDGDSGTDTDSASTDTGPFDRDGDGWVAAEDCDDDDASAHPNATEVCDHADNDCDGATDEAGADGTRTWWVDTDVDGYGDHASSTVACDAPAWYVDNDLDCDDTDETVVPGAGHLGIGWPKPAALWLTYDAEDVDDPCRYAEYSVVIDAGALATLASAHDWSLVEASEVVHTLNPDLVLLTSVRGTAFEPGGDGDLSAESCWSDAFYVKDTAGDPVAVWDGSLRAVDVTNPDARMCVIVAAVTALQGTIRTETSAANPVYDGTLVTDSSTSGDGVFYTSDGGTNDVDLDGDGVADDHASFAADWQEGSALLWTELREYSGMFIPDLRLYASGWLRMGTREPLWSVVDGVIENLRFDQAYEDADPDAWLDAFYTERTKPDDTLGTPVFLGSGDEAYTSTAYTSASATDIEAVRTDWERARYTIVSGLLIGAATGQEWGQTGHGQGWSYDEFDAEGPGYLGEPVADARPWDVPTTGTIVLSEGFEAADPAWGTWTCDRSDGCGAHDYTLTTEITTATAGAGAGSWHATIAQDDDVDHTDWDVIAYHDALTLRQGRQYLVTFMARADQPRLIQAYLQNTSGGWSTPDAGSGVIADTTWRTYWCPITADDLGLDTSAGRLAFALGTNDGEVWLDAVNVIEADGPWVWYREFAGGIALINIGAGTEHVVLSDRLSGSWRHLLGTLDPATNDGSPVEELDLPPFGAIVLVRS